jgi:hypothetical protein
LLGWIQSVEKQARSKDQARPGPIVICYESVLLYESIWMRRDKSAISVVPPSQRAASLLVKHSTELAGAQTVLWKQHDQDLTS